MRTASARYTGDQFPKTPLSSIGRGRIACRRADDRHDVCDVHSSLLGRALDREYRDPKHQFTCNGGQAAPGESTGNASDAQPTPSP